MKKRILSLFLLVSIVMGAFVLPVSAARERSAEEISAMGEVVPTREVSASELAVPDYDGGKASEWMSYDCGVAATYGNTGSESLMQIVTSTTAAQYQDYCKKLDGGNYTKIYTNTVPAQNGSNLYAKYLSKDGTHSLYTYFTAATTQTRIIIDTQKESFRTYSYDGKGSLRTEFYMYGLSNAEDGFAASDGVISRQDRSNGGAFLIMRMADNSLFIIDGGGSDQMSDRSCEDLYAFLRRITNTKDSEKLLINTWFITHPHVDHCAGIARFLHKYCEHFDLRTIMYNFDVVSGSTQYIQRVSRMFPNAQYYKHHTGESFTVCDVRFDVLYTVEDRYFPNSNNQLIKGDKTCMDNTNENNISSVLRVSFGGKTLILTGDIGNADTIMMKMYPASALKADLLQLPHHGFDNHTTLAKTVAPTISILNQSGSAAATKKNIYTFNTDWSPYTGTIYYGGSHTIGYAADEGVFLQEPVLGLDHLSWDGRTYDMTESQVYQGESKVYAPETYYRYTKVNRLTTTQKAYLIADKKLNRVLSYDATDGTTDSATTGLFDGTHWYFAGKDRHKVNWLISGTKIAYPHGKSPASNAEVTYHTDFTLAKGKGGYWSTGDNPAGIVLGNGDEFTSTGLYNSWCPFTEELEATSKWTWFDALSDGSFLIYRHTGGYYYPLYRDGNIADQGGWGTTKIIPNTDVNSRISYLSTELYAYEETASKMYLTWTGHKEYTCYTGIPANNLISLLTADIRVNWAFENFEGSGEAFHTSLNRQSSGDYWFEFSPAYQPSVVQTYTTTIKYKTANGTILGVGTFTVRVEARSSQDLGSKELYFTFDDTTADRNRYKNESQYKEINFDGTSRWLCREYDPATQMTAELSATVSGGSLTLQKTANTQGTDLYVEAYGKGTTPLSYKPKNAQTLQIRFKLDGLKGGQESSFRLSYYKTDGTCVADASLSLPAGYTTDSYRVINLELSQTLRNLSSIAGIRLEFHDFVLTNSKQAGSVILDYIYIGPSEGVPTKHSYAAEVIQPTCIAQGYTLHTCIHCGDNYRDTYTAIDPSAHNYSYRASKQPTLTNKGTLTGSCSICGGSTTMTLPVLNATDYVKATVQEPTCTERGTDNYRWKNTAYGSYTFSIETDALGHKYGRGEITKIPTLTTQGEQFCTCERNCGHTATLPVDTLRESLYMGFENTAADQARYDNYAYGFQNFDTSEHWVPEDGALDTIDHANGILILQPKTAATTLKVRASVDDVTQGKPLYFDPAKADAIQLRLKFEKVGVLEGKNALVSVDPYVGNTKIDLNDQILTKEQVTGDNYFIVTIPISAQDRERGILTNIRVYLGNMSFTTASKVYIDYIYVGAETGLPTPRHTVIFQNADGTVLDTVTVYHGEKAQFTGATPTKAYDSTNHYTFKGWDNSLTSVQSDLTVTAQFTATAHSYTYSKVDGTNHKCSCSCGYSKNVAHTWNTGAITTQPTCTASGVKTYTCTTCKATKTETIAATGHTEVVDKAVAATCTTAGKTEGSHCSVCNAVIKAQTTVPATGHSYTSKETTAATCTKDGVKTYTCSKCSHSYTEAIAATGHTEVVDKAVAATCTTAGKTEGSHCSVCNVVIKAQTTVPATGHSYTSKVTTAATCTKDGVKTFTCSKCSHSYTEAIAATGHTEVVDKAVAATCTTDGKTEGSHCSVCNAVIKAQTTISATGHSYTSKVTTAATCTKNGVKTFTCSKCSHSYTEAIAATGHTEVVDKAVAATCTTAGKTEGSHCSVCNAVIKAQTTIPATGHSYTSKVTTAATCTKAGVKTFTCSKCNHSYTEAIAATGHTEVVDKAVAATCTTAGKTEGSHCSVCNAVIKAQTTVPATGHSYTSKVTTAATCTKAGVKTFTCSKCNHSYTEAIAATGHTEVIDKAVAATCTTAGKTEGSHCSVCNTVIKAQTTVPATGHNYTSKVTTAATCTKDGAKTFTCSKCNHSYTETIAATGHTEVIDKAVAATCTTAGKTEGSHCSACNAVIKAQTTVPATGHSYSYKSNGDGTHTTNCARCNDSYTENHNFGNGACACGDTEITLDESIKILHTLDLASDISVTFAVAQSALTNYDSYYLECVLPEYSGNAKIGTSTVEVQPVVSGNYYYFTLTGITAVRMGDMVEAVLHMTKGGQEYISKTDSYSVATYAYGMLNSSKDAKMLTLCADLLRYGAEAQSLKGYRTDALVDADMTETHRSYLSSAESLTFTATDSNIGDISNPTITWVGKTLDLGSKVGMKFVFNAKNYSGDLSKLSMKVTYQGSTGETKSVTVTGIETYNANNKQYSFTFYGLLASELRTVVDVAIYEGNTQLSETLHYSAESYAAKTGTTALAALTKALFAYSDSAKSFFAK